MDIKELIKSNYRQIVFIFFAFMTMVLVSYLYVGDIVRKQTLAIGEGIMNTAEAVVSATFSEATLSFSYVAWNVESMMEDGQDNVQILEYLTEVQNAFYEDRENSSNFMMIYGVVRDAFLDGSGWVPPDDYVPQSRLWYSGAEEQKGDIFTTAPYIDADTGDPVISLSRTIFLDGEPQGVLAIDMNLSAITDYIEGRRINSDGYGILISNTMQFAVYPDEGRIGTSVYDAGEGFIRLGSMIETGESLAAERFTDLNGVDSIAHIRTIVNGWHIGVIAPRDSYYKQVSILGGVLSTLGIILMVALSYLLLRIRYEKFQADEESRSKSGFLARMSHEMRTPMNAIIGMTTIARGSDDMERIHYCLDRIEEASDHLLGVINDVLDISATESGGIHLTEVECAFSDIISQTLSVVGIKFEEKKQEFKVELDSRIPPLLVVDRQRLAQVLANLLSNASKFTPEGGHIRLSAELEDKDIDQVRLLFKVEDDGIGIPHERQAKLFQTFEQADGGTSRRFGGTGIGLVISKRIIEAMNGVIWFDSEEGKGSVFQFLIYVGLMPQQEVATEEEAIGASQDEEPSFDGKRILLAEDVEINREIVMALLEDTGVIIDVAENGQIACEKFFQANGEYDMVFMDIHMPEVDGYEATRRIRAMMLPNAETVPIVAMTANVFPEDVEQCLNSGMNDHIGKPLEMDEVFEKMEKYMLGMSSSP